MPTNRMLTLADIKDLREYEREREAFRSHIIEMKARRRFTLGPLMTIVFENWETMRFQVQEMARAERMLSDDQISHEVEEYNQLIPAVGELVGTLFIEITDKSMLMEWLPKLVGIQRALLVRLGDGAEVHADPLDEERLTREEVTTSVHYLKFHFTPEQVAAFERGPATIVVDHPSYQANVILTDEQRAEVLTDLRP
jgi:hypothetical protein